jgi:hypothetical protein
MSHGDYKHLAEWRRVGHIPVLIILQIIFIILFARFVIYHPDNAVHSSHSNEQGIKLLELYPSIYRLYRSRYMIYIHFKISVPGCARHDIHWIRLSYDISEKIWLVGGLLEHAECSHLSSMGHPGYRILPLAQGSQGPTRRWQLPR